MRGVLLTFLIATIAFGAGLTETRADAGIGISPGAIDVDDTLMPGGRYSLPPVTVINTGTQSHRYEVVVSHLDDEAGLKPPQKWIRSSPSQFELKPGESRLVELDVALPGGAQPGLYSALIEAQFAAQGSQTVTASVAARLAFTVGESSWLETTRRQINQFLDDNGLWIVLGLGGVLSTGAFMTLNRRVRFRLPFEPR